MGNEYEWKKERRRAEVLRRCWRISVFTTGSTCGSRHGIANERVATGSWCVMPTTSWLDSSSRPMPSSFGQNSPREWASSTWNCIPRKCDFGSLDRLPSMAGSGVEQGSRRRSIFRLYAHLREEEEQRTLHGVAANGAQTTAGEAERGKSRTSAAPARTHPRTRQVAASGGAGTHSLLRSAAKPIGAKAVSIPRGLALAAHAVAAQPERRCPLASYAAPDRPLAASACCLSSLSSAAHGRHYLRQEPDAGNPPVRIGGGGCEQS